MMGFDAETGWLRGVWIQLDLKRCLIPFHWTFGRPGMRSRKSLRTCLWQGRGDPEVRGDLPLQPVFFCAA
jgi:hypothetical protein